MGVALKGKSVELTGPFATGSTFSENLLLEYTNGMQGASLGWGRLTREKLERVLEIHAVYADLMRRTPYLARARGSNLLAHVAALARAGGVAGSRCWAPSVSRGMRCCCCRDTIPICRT